MAKNRHINVQISPELLDEAREMIPWGLRGHLFQSILRLIIDAIRQDGQIVTGAILAGEYKLSLVRRDSDPIQNLNRTSDGPS